MRERAPATAAGGALLLAAAGLGAGLLAGAAPARAESVGTYLIGTGAVWRYRDDGSNQGSAWRAPLFDDSTWAAGPAELGYGDGDEATIVHCGPGAPACTTGNFITTYFRRTFPVADAASIPRLELRIRRDDGAVAYLNGVEVARTNMPAGTVTYTTPASSAQSGAGETTFVVFPIEAAAVADGPNVLAVEVHQSSASSSDVSFDASLQVVAAPPLSLVRAPYLQNVTPHGAVVRWRTSAATTTRVRWGLAPDALTETVDVPGTRTEHVVPLTGLPAETRIFYAVGTAAGTLAGGDADHGFATPPPSGQRRPIRIWVTGDHGMCGASAQGCADAAAVRNGYTAFAGSRPADLWLMLGDNAYNSGTDLEFTRGQFDVYPTILRRTPFWSAPGNHEFGPGGADSPTQSGPYYDAHTFPTAGEGGGVPSGTEAYYSFDWGNVHVLVLDSHDTSRAAPASPTTNVCPPGQGGAMYQWACADLAAATGDFVIAIWHHPPYSKGSHDSDTESQLVEMRQRFLPVMEHFGVDLVLTGHSHSYERSVLLDGHYGHSSTYSPALHAVDAGDGDPAGDGAYVKGALGPRAHTGTVNAVPGNASQISGGPLNHPVMEKSLNVLGSMVIDVVGRQLDARLIGVSGTVLDHFRIVKGDPLPACADGLDQDGDGRIDHPQDPGCAGPAATTEDPACDNGVDDDGDGLADFPADPGCETAASSREDPACDDDLDNDGDGGIDWDGGAAQAAPDPDCDVAYRAREKPAAGCGLGAELVLALPLAAALRRRSRPPAAS